MKLVISSKYSPPTCFTVLLGEAGDVGMRSRWDYEAKVLGSRGVSWTVMSAWISMEDILKVKSRRRLEDGEAGTWHVELRVLGFAVWRS